MKLPGRVLIHSPLGIEAAKARLAADRKPKLTMRLRDMMSGTVGVLGNNLGGLGYMLRPSEIFASAPAETAGEAGRTPVAPTVARVTIGIWSLDAWLGNLVELIDGLNSTQNAFIFYPVEAAVPAGLISRPERVIPWLTQAIGELDESTRGDIEDNLIANDFFGLADGVRVDLGLDYIVGITPSMIAGEDDGTYYWNHFSTCEDRAILVSSYDLQDFSRETGQPVDAFLAIIIVSQFLAAFAPDVHYHDDNGCLFDYDASRTSIKDKVKDPRIEPGCLELIQPQYRDAALGLVETLKKLRRPPP